MNTVLRGDTFEQNSYELIKKSIENDEFGISPKYAQVFLKPKYHSLLRNKEIIFDLSIEVWPPGAQRRSLLYLIECKSYSTKNVPVDDIEEFLLKTIQIQNTNIGQGVKAVFISNSSFQEGAVDIAKNSGLMLIEVNSENQLSIKLHKAERDDNKAEADSEREVESFLFKIFDLNKIQGLKKLNKKDISNITENLLNEIDKTYFNMH